MVKIRNILLISLGKVLLIQPIPVVLKSDCGVQISSRKCRQFCNEFEIRHFMSSPNLHKANSEAERTLDTD